MKFFLSMLLSGLLLGSAACTKMDDKNSEAVNVDDLNKQFISAWNNKELDKTIGFLADDVHFLQGAAHYNGKAAVSDKWVRSTQPTISNLKTYVVSTGSDQNIAYQAGTYSVDVMPEGPGQPMGIGEGNFLLLWKKVADGSWKLSHAQLEGLPVRVRTQ
jgi:ketosteroid isomerase-like protein